MAELVVKKWQLGRVLTAKKYGKSRILRIQSRILRIQSHILRIQTHILRIQTHVSRIQSQK